MDGPDARSAPAERRAGPPRVLAAVVFAAGCVLSAGGVPLVLLGGSAYYLIAGVALLAAGVQIWLGKRRGAWLYGAVLSGTLAWTVWEVGFDWWAWVPRLAFLAVLGLWLLLPSVRRRLVR